MERFVPVFRIHIQVQLANKGRPKYMKQWDHKKIRKQLLVLISCFAVSIPAIAGPGLCQDDCSHCTSTGSDTGAAETKSPCCCCEAPAEEAPSCCQSEETSTIQQTCSCLGIPAAPQASSAMEKTEELVSSLVFCQQLSPFVVPAAPVDTCWHSAKISGSNNPKLLRSVILLI